MDTEHIVFPEISGGFRPIPEIPDSQPFTRLGRASASPRQWAKGLGLASDRLTDASVSSPDASVSVC